MKFLLSILLSLHIINAQAIEQNNEKSIVSNRVEVTSHTQEKKIVVDKIALVQKEDLFEKNISIQEMNKNIQSYISILQKNLVNVKPNIYVLEVAYTVKDQTFKLQTKTPVTKEEQPTYNKIYEELKKLKKQTVKENLNIILYLHKD